MRQFTIQRVLLVTLAVLLFVIATRVPVDTDTWWHLRSGEYTLNEGMIYEDPFSHTKQGEPWTNHSWLSQVVMQGAYALAGDAGLALYTALLAAAGVLMLYPVLKGNAYLRAFLLILSATAAAVFWSARPQMTSFFFSGVMVYLLYRYKRHGVDWLWFIPPLMLVWGNLHAGFSIGFILMFGVLAGEIANNLFRKGAEDVIPWVGVRKLALVAAVSVGALVINPYGLEMLQVPFETVSIGALRQYIQEWQSPNFQGRETWTFVAMLILLLGAFGASKRSLDWTDFFLVIGTLFMSLLYGRNIALFAVAALPALSVHADAVLEQQGWTLTPRTRVTRQQARINVGLAALIVFGGLANFLSLLNPTTVDEFQQERLPVEAATFIESTQPPGPMFNSYNWGGYLMWALPEYPVYVDGRTDLYRSEFLGRWLRTAQGSGDWRSVLDEDGINLVVIEQSSGLDTRLRDEPGWSAVYPPPDSEDEQVVIYTRDEPIGS